MVSQRRMIRNVVGWVRVHDEDWDTTMRRMRTRVQRGMLQYHVREWEQVVDSRRWKHACRVANMSSEAWARLAVEWDPRKTYPATAWRGRGRPLSKWDDFLTAARSE